MIIFFLSETIIIIIIINNIIIINLHEKIFLMLKKHYKNKCCFYEYAFIYKPSKYELVMAKILKRKMYYCNLLHFKPIQLTLFSGTQTFKQIYCFLSPYNYNKCFF